MCLTEWKLGNNNVFTCVKAGLIDEQDLNALNVPFSLTGRRRRRYIRIPRLKFTNTKSMTNNAGSREASQVPVQEMGDRNTVGRMTTLGRVMVSTSLDGADVHEVGDNVGLRAVQEVGDNVGLRAVQEVGDNVGLRAVQEVGDNVGLGAVQEVGRSAGLGAVQEVGDSAGLGAVQEVGGSAGLGAVQEVGGSAGLGAVQEVGGGAELGTVQEVHCE